MSFFRRHAYAIGCGAAALVWPFFAARRKIAVANILRGGVTASRDEARRIARQSFCHFAGHICEAICVSGVITRENWREHVDDSGLSSAARRLLCEETDKPVLIVSSHHGSWEIATYVIPWFRPMIAVARTMNNKYVARWMKGHFRGNVTIVDKNDGMKERVLRQWQETRAGLTLLMDQYSHRGALVKFFGRPARTVTSPARLAIRTGSPIIIGSFVRTGPYRYRMVAGDPITFPRETDREVATQILNDRLEEQIRLVPEQYLWIHRRWRDD